MNFEQYPSRSPVRCRDLPALLMTLALVATGLVAAALLPRSAAASTAWVQPTVLDTAEPTALRLTTAIDGTVVAAWILPGTGGDALRAAVRLPGDVAWSSTVTVASGLSAGARIDGLVSGGAGTATVAVVDRSGLAVYARQSGAWSRSWVIADADAAALAVGPSGVVAVAATRGSGTTRSVIVRERPTPAGSWTAALVRATGANIGLPMIGLGTAPGLVVGWIQNVDPILQTLHVRRRSTTGTWTGVLRRDTYGYFGQVLATEAGVAPDGTFSALIHLTDGTSLSLFVEHLSAGNAWSTDALLGDSASNRVAGLRVSPLDGSAAWQWWGPGYYGSSVGAGITGRSGSTGPKWGPDTLGLSTPPVIAAVAPWRNGQVSLALYLGFGPLLVASGSPGAWLVGQPPQATGEGFGAADIGVSAAGVTTLLYTSSVPGISGTTLRASQDTMMLPLPLGRTTLRGGTSVGTTLTCASGTWSEAAVLAYSWYRDGARLSPRTATYRVVAADRGKRITCGVTGANISGTTTEVSAPITIR